MMSRRSSAWPCSAHPQDRHGQGVRRATPADHLPGAAVAGLRGLPGAAHQPALHRHQPEAQDHPGHQLPPRRRQIDRGRQSRRHPGPDRGQDAAGRLRPAPAVAPPDFRPARHAGALRPAGRGGRTRGAPCASCASSTSTSSPTAPSRPTRRNCSIPTKCGHFWPAPTSATTTWSSTCRRCCRWPTP